MGSWTKKAWSSWMFCCAGARCVILSFGANWVVWSLWLSGLHVYLVVGSGRQLEPTRVASLGSEKRSHENIPFRACN
ncbi:hypothetical protein B0T14DRAFT_125626 [Immersiella caudata]|uniref:Uncharacterized protein n=1 Tax=Immersiella caudata TaxID=314043 RepID=A0AA40C6R3_9PEZI|nr:hypothetical protein B0T14DRAFT_125626 [Immersiella caudata]